MGTNKDPELSIDEGLKKEVDNVIEEYQLLKTCSCVPSNVSEIPEPQYAHCLSRPITKSLACLLSSLLNSDITVNYQLHS
jgi:division protein CdvB (Snf7/Vps24/ESCRT-III family)